MSYLEIIDKLPIQKGDILNISSDLLPLICMVRKNKEKFDVNLFLDKIIEKVGDEGTILIPTYNWDFCSGKIFDPKKTPSQVGSLGNIAIKRDDFIRTKHPIYSFCVKGKDSEYLYSLDPKNAFGKGTVFEYLYHKRVKNLFIGLDYKKALTFVHFPEELVGVDYRYQKEFVSRYLENGKILQKGYQFYVREPKKCKMTYIDEKLDSLLKEYWFNIINGVYFGVVNLGEIGDIMINDLKTKKEIVYPIL